MPWQPQSVISMNVDDLSISSSVRHFSTPQSNDRLLVNVHINESTGTRKVMVLDCAPVVACWLRHRRLYVWLISRIRPTAPLLFWLSIAPTDKCLHNHTAPTASCSCEVINVSLFFAFKMFSSISSYMVVNNVLANVDVLVEDSH